MKATLLARACRHTDPAFLHYRSGAFMAERSRQVPGIDPLRDAALSFAACADDPASGGRHKVWGSKPLWVLPRAFIASHLPKALGTALAIERASGWRRRCRFPPTVSCSARSATPRPIATAQTAFNTAMWASKKLPAPILFVCEDNGLGISVKTPMAGSPSASATSRGWTISSPMGWTWPPGTPRCRPRWNTAGERGDRLSCICAPRA